VKMLLESPSWWQRSDRAIYRHTGTGYSVIRSVRQEMRGTPEPAAGDTRIGVDGKSHPAARKIVVKKKPATSATPAPASNGTPAPGPGARGPEQVDVTEPARPGRNGWLHEGYSRSPRPGSNGTGHNGAAQAVVSARAKSLGERIVERIASAALQLAEARELAGELPQVQKAITNAQGMCEVARRAAWSCAACWPGGQPTG
jgi:hypothetical protein